MYYLRKKKINIQKQISEINIASSALRISERDWKISNLILRNLSSLKLEEKKFQKSWIRFIFIRKLKFNMFLLIKNLSICRTNLTLTLKLKFFLLFALLFAFRELFIWFKKVLLSTNFWVSSVLFFPC